jgi:hypothetical protein
MSVSVIPAKAGIQEQQEPLDPGFRRGDGLEDFLPSNLMAIEDGSDFHLWSHDVSTGKARAGSLSSA